jgi:uncharacterized protein
MSVDTLVEQPDKLKSNTLPKRIFGKTGEEVPILGLGTAPGGMGLPDAEAIDLIHAAIDLGVTYLDTAPGYERAQIQLGEVLPERRDEVFLVTKTLTETAEKALEILENSLRDLKTDQVDLTFLHSVGSQDVDAILAPDGALAGLREAQKRGWTRYIGLTAHHRSARACRILQEEDVDAVMFALNYADRHTYNFQADPLELARAQHTGIAAMKVFGGAPEMKYDAPTRSQMHRSGIRDHAGAMRYALSLPGVSLAVVGMFSVEELEENVAYARTFEPMDAPAMAAIEEEGKKLAEAWKDHFGPVE